MKVLIIGASGQVGQELMYHAPREFEVKGLNSGCLDISEPAQINSKFVEHSPELVINASAYTAVDQAESDKERAYAVNARGVKYLAETARYYDIPVFHISTDYVFNGQSATPYREDDPTDPVNIYGDSKLQGETYLSGILPNHIILRTSWVFGRYGNNFVKTMLKLGVERSHLNIVSDQAGCPASAASIAKALWELALRWERERGKEDNFFPWGTYHFVNMPATSWYEFATDIFSQAQSLELLQTTPDLTAIQSKDFPTQAERPLFSVLDCSKWKAIHNKTYQLPSWKAELHEVLCDLNKEML